MAAPPLAGIPKWQGDTPCRVDASAVPSGRQEHAPTKGSTVVPTTTVAQCHARSAGKNAPERRGSHSSPHTPETSHTCGYSPLAGGEKHSTKGAHNPQTRTTEARRRRRGWKASRSHDRGRKEEKRARGQTAGYVTKGKSAQQETQSTQIDITEKGKSQQPN